MASFIKISQKLELMSGKISFFLLYLFYISIRSSNFQLLIHLLFREMVNNKKKKTLPSFIILNECYFKQGRFQLPTFNVDSSEYQTNRILTEGVCFNLWTPKIKNPLKWKLKISLKTYKIAQFHFLVRIIRVWKCEK